MFKALVIENDEQGYRSLLKDLPESQLPDHDVTLDVSYSSLNYKDALAICNKGPIVRQFPMVPGIDFVGRVTASRHPDWQQDDVALLTGWRGRKTVGWPGAESQRDRRLAGRGARYAQPAANHGDWHRRPDRDAVRDGAGKTGHHAGSRSGAGNRCQRRRRQL